MNEWQLQEMLTSQWTHEGVTVQDHPYFLVAWEVMAPSWRINDSATFWAEPSIDFLVASADGGLLAIELKTSIPGVLPAWRTLCQVTHRSLVLRQSWSFERMSTAYEAARGGRHGRLPTSSVSSLPEAHQAFFGLERPVLGPCTEIVRAVAAAHFGPRFEQVLGEFNALHPSLLAGQLGTLGLLDGRKINLEPRRLARALEEGLRPTGNVLVVDVSS